MPLLPEFPISGDDYTVGTITLVAGSKDFTTKDAYIDSYGAVRPGDHIYVSTAGKFLIVASITGENSGTLTDPCPSDCAVTDMPLRVIFKTASSRAQGRVAMVLATISQGNLASIAEVQATAGQILRATNVPGEWEAIDLPNFDKFMSVDVYDKNGKKADVYDAGNFVENKTAHDNKGALILTNAERMAISDNTDGVADNKAKIDAIKGLPQDDWNAGTSTTNALISPLAFLTTLTNLGVWKGGSKFGNNTNGGFILPNGLIIQYGSANNSSSADYRISFPSAFPTKCFCFLPVNTYGMGGDQFIGVSTSTVSASGADIRCRGIFSGLVQGQLSVPVIWLAIGV